MTAHSRDDIQRPRLGRGLAALLGEGHEGQGVQSARAQRQLPIERLRANTLNPRKVFDAQEMENLAQSIRSRGVLQPILVRPLDGSTTEYEIVAGERRWRRLSLVAERLRVSDGGGDASGVAGHLLATGRGQNSGLFDIAPDGRALVAEDLPGTFQLIPVRNWKRGLAKSGQ